MFLDWAGTQDIRYEFDGFQPVALDRLRDYATNGSIRCDVILEYTSAAATVFSRAAASDPWKAVALTQDDTVKLPEIGIEIPLAAFYDAVDFDGAAASIVLVSADAVRVKALAGPTRSLRFCVRRVRGGGIAGLPRRASQ